MLVTLSGDCTHCCRQMGGGGDESDPAARLDNREGDRL